MEKWCDYGISNASKENGEITEVYVHKDMGDYFQAIGVMTENQVIALIDKGFSFITILWGILSGGRAQKYLLLMDKTEDI